MYKIELIIGGEQGERRKASGKDLHKLFKKVFNPQLETNSVLNVEKGKQKFSTLVVLRRAKRMAINPLSRELLIKLIANGLK